MSRRHHWTGLALMLTVWFLHMILTAPPRSAW